MKKIRKSQKRLITIFIIIIAIIVIIGIVGFVLKRQAPEETENQDTIITLPETQYSDMEVKNVQMEYLKENKIKYNKIYSERPTLNDVFLELTGKELRD